MSSVEKLSTGEDRVHDSKPSFLKTEPVEIAVETSKRSEILQARRLHAARYLSEGYVEPDEIDIDGTISTEVDPYSEYSRYFVVRQYIAGESIISAAARQIPHDTQQGLDSFPVLNTPNIYPIFKLALEDMDYTKMVEISALVKDQEIASEEAPFLLYRAMWQQAIYEDQEVWLMALDPRLFTRLKMHFGGSLERIGADTRYPGKPVVPSSLMPRQALHYMCGEINATNDQSIKEHRRFVLEYFVDGFDMSCLTDEERTNLDVALDKSKG